MSANFRLRFAPSPTGPLHIGGVRTALYNYLYARKMGGKFILRIEDTDQERIVPGAEQYIEQSLEWLGIMPDEGPSQGGPWGPYRQSDRRDIYRDYALQLIEKGKAYFAFDTPEDIEQLRRSGHGNQKYDYNTRNSMQNSLTLPERTWKQKIEAGEAYVVRLKVPVNEQIQIEDAVRGKVSFHTAELDDKVLIKSDGMPTYHMANVVDDHLMRISHVIRGEEWLSSTAHHVLLYRAFDWQDGMPVFAHLPLILKPAGHGKLSKRDGAKFGFPVFPIDWKAPDGEVFAGFREYGFEPEAVLNFLALLGWNDGSGQELFNIQELTERFSLDKIVKSGARFDFDKAKWFNQQVILNKSSEEIVSKIISMFEKAQMQISPAKARQIYNLYKDRIVFLKDLLVHAEYLVKSEMDYNKTETQDFIQKKWRPEWKDAFRHLAQQLETLPEWNRHCLETSIRQFAEQQSLKMGDVWPCMRVFVSGIPTGPDALSMIEYTGRETTVKRMSQFIQHLN